MELEKEEVREIKSAEQSDLEVSEPEVVEESKEPKKQRIGTITAVLVPYDFEGEKYFYKIKPMNIDQQTEFITKFPNAPTPDLLSTEEMAQIVKHQKGLLMTNLLETPDGPVTKELLDELKPMLFKELIQALAGGYDEDFTEK